LQEREKTEILVCKAAAEGNHEGSEFQQEWIVFNQRRFEGLEMAREQLTRELKRQRQLNGRMGEEIEHLRGQLRTTGAYKGGREGGKHSLVKWNVFAF
jgi:hypothetical protein